MQLCRADKGEIFGVEEQQHVLLVLLLRKGEAINDVLAVDNGLCIEIWCFFSDENCHDSGFLSFKQSYDGMLSWPSARGYASFKLSIITKKQSLLQPSTEDIASLAACMVIERDDGQVLPLIPIQQQIRFYLVDLCP